jgi:hypothetical protein
MVRRQPASRHRWRPPLLHTGEHGLRAQRGVLNGRTAPDLDGHFDMAEPGVVLRVHRRFRGPVAAWSAGPTES